MDEIRIDMALTRAEYVRGVQAYLRCAGIFYSFDWVILLAITALTAALLWLTGMTLVNTALVVVLVLTTGIGTYIYLLLPGRTYHRNPKLGERTVYTFTAANIGVRSESVAGVIQWSFLRFYQTGEWFILVQDQHRYAFFPKNLFPDEGVRRAFTQMVLTAVPDIKYKEYR